METCYYCKGHLKATLIQHVHRWQGDLFIFDQVPAKVCEQCGEQFLSGDVLTQIDRLVIEGPSHPPDAVREVPVYSLAGRPLSD